MIDGDHFKAVNDNYGHQTGDEIMGTFYDFVFVSISLLKDLHHDPCQNVSQNFQAFVTVIIHICNKKIILQVIVVLGKVT